MTSKFILSNFPLSSGIVSSISYTNGSISLEWKARGGGYSLHLQMFPLNTPLFCSFAYQNITS